MGATVLGVEGQNPLFSIKQYSTQETLVAPEAVVSEAVGGPVASRTEGLQD